MQWIWHIVINTHFSMNKIDLNNRRDLINSDCWISEIVQIYIIHTYIHTYNTCYTYETRVSNFYTVSNNTYLNRTAMKPYS